MFAENGFSLSDIASVVKSDDGTWNNGSWIWLLIILIFLNGGYGFNNGYGRNDAGAYDNYVLASDFSQLSRQIDTATDGLRQQSTQIANGLCDGFYTQAQLVNGVNQNIYSTGQNILTQMNNNAINSMQDTFGLQTAINGVNVNTNNNAQGLTAQLTALGNQMSNCCCDNRNLISTNFGNLKYDMAAQDCQIRQTVNDVGRNLADVQNANTQAILSAIQKISDDAKDEKIATLQAKVTQMQSVADNMAQTNAFTTAINNAVNELRVPTPIPAFQVNPPFAYTNCNGCGC